MAAERIVELDYTWVNQGLQNALLCENLFESPVGHESRWEHFFERKEVMGLKLGQEFILNLGR